MRNVFDRHITCAFLYSITRYGYPPDAEHMVTYVHEMADLGFQSIELEGIGEAHLKTVYKHRKEIKQALEDRGWRYLCFVPYFRDSFPTRRNCTKEFGFI